MLTMADDELEVIAAIYCQPGEICVSKGADGSRQVKVRVRATAGDGDTDSSPLEADLILQLPSPYPAKAPEISVCSDQLSRIHTARIRTLLCEKASEGLGQPILMDLISLASEELDKLVTEEDSENLASVVAGGDPIIEDRTVQGSCEDRLVLLHLDHMRAKTQYVKLIRKWAGELSLAGCLLFCQRLILIVLQGPAAAVKEYIVRQRTNSVDVDSRGQPCKERMLSVVCDIAAHQNHFRFKNFEVLEPNNAEDLKGFFSKCNLENLFLDHIPTLKHYPGR